MISHDVKLLAVFDKLDKKIDKVSTTLGKVGPQGIQGDKGAVGPQGPVGAKGPSGSIGGLGAKGEAGVDGLDGVSINDVTVDFDNHLVVSFSDGSTIDAGEIQLDGTEAGKGASYTISTGARLDKPYITGTETLDFGSGAMSTSVVVTDINKVFTSSFVAATLRIEATAEHSIEDLVIDPIQVTVQELVEGVGFTIVGRMFNARANGTYKVNWIIY